MGNYLSIVYVSTALSKFTDRELFDLLEKSRANNVAAGITGMLLYDDGNFMQAIEGPEDQVRRLHEKIHSDRRHNGMILLLEEEIEEREFPMWSMGFKDFSNAPEKELEGFSNLMHWRTLPKEFLATPSRAKKLLLSFRKSVSLR